MARFQLHYGLKPIGPHRNLTDSFLTAAVRTCSRCEGQAVLGSPDMSSWSTCPDCRGYGSHPFPNSPELRSIRSQVARYHPDALFQGADDVGLDTFRALLEQEQDVAVVHDLTAGAMGVDETGSAQPADQTRPALPKQTEQSTALPDLSATVITGFPPDALEGEQVCADPETWDSLEPGILRDVLWHALVMYGITQDAARLQSVQDLYAVAVRRLSVQDRLEVSNRLAEYIENSRRSGRFVSSVAFLPAIQIDTDSQVVSTASLNRAVLMGSGADDSMTGRLSVHRMAMETANAYRRAWILAGLISLGDGETLGLLRRSWEDLPDDCRNHLSFTAGQLPFASVTDFLLLWAEDALDVGDEYEMTRALGALVRLARIGRGERQNPYSGRGICVIQRRFPAWAHPRNEGIQFGDWWSPEDFARILKPRLRALARRERDAPSIAEAVLNEWRQLAEKTDAA